MFGYTFRSMKKTFEMTAKRVKDQDDLVYIRRVCWIEFEERTKDAFSKLDTDENASSAFGKFYRSSVKDYPPYRNHPRLYTTNILNHIQISASARLSRTFKTNEAGATEIIHETGSALWFTQDLSGGVAVFLAPYKSQNYEVTEKNVLIKYYKSPSELSAKKIEKLIILFIKYCEATLYSSTHSRRLYIFRLWLQLKDIRNRKKIKQFLIKTAGQTLAFLLAGLGVLATLYTGGAFTDKPAPEVICHIEKTYITP